MAKEDQTANDEPWERVGLTFTFAAETLKEVLERGKDYRGEYGTYKYLGPEKPRTHATWRR